MEKGGTSFSITRMYFASTVICSMSCTLGTRMSYPLFGCQGGIYDSSEGTVDFIDTIFHFKGDVTGYQSFCGSDLCRQIRKRETIQHEDMTVE